MKLPKLIYVAGKLKGDNISVTNDNIRNAAVVSALIIQVASRKWFPMCPHTATNMIFVLIELNCLRGSEIDSPIWHKGSMSMLSACDAMIVLPDYENSKGVRGEIKYAEDNGIPIVFLERINTHQVRESLWELS